MPPNSAAAATVVATTAPAAAAFSALATAAAAAPSPATSEPAAARLFSLHAAPPTAKILHLIRHAEGTHNVSPDAHKTPLHWDAKLTERGLTQCRELAGRRIHVDCVVVSPMTRCLQTAVYALPHCYYGGPHDVRTENNENNGASGSSIDAMDGSSNRQTSTAPAGQRTRVPFVAHEAWRETVNFLCDSRRPLTDLRDEFPRVDFDSIQSEHDPIWSNYESQYGAYDEFDELRESRDGAHLAKRAREAWTVLADRPERNLALVGHSAFFMHMFTPYLEEMMGLVEYHDEEVRELMMGSGFDNCELRSVAFEAVPTATT